MQTEWPVCAHPIAVVKQADFLIASLIFMRMFFASGWLNTRFNTADQQ